jgi:hypothetical protein
VGVNHSIKLAANFVTISNAARTSTNSQVADE